VTHPFQVLLEPEGEPPLVVEGTMLQEAVLPRWLAWLLAGLLFLIAALIALYLAVLRPAIRSDAKEAAREEAKKVAEQAGGAAGAAAGDKAGKDAVAGPIAEAQRQLDTIADALKTTLPPISSATPAPFAEDPTLGRSLTARLAVNGGGTQTATRTFGDDEAFSLTDLIFQNPAGDRGLLQVFRGDDLLFSSRLENFRDLDEHFVAPFVFEPGQKLRLVVNCENVAPAAANCTAGVTFGGFVRTPQPTPSAAPTP
jgi:hypothetical protein